ncbi:hypothetical protein [Aestuariispira insulae]|uniref:Uncharacterized protein n=1 Tax=Aestuariispira insulae TaxID=1461337 RepID=A0A3D9HRU6_9PROT|nr:hypothetical protein [Aestuariispira insulae]RED52190.1 hypothetical protein DFP90_102208 [Aestuariispira insulae]
MKENIVHKVTENGMAVSTVSGGGWLTYEAVTQGMNLFAALLGVISACLAIWWWLIKIGKERHDAGGGKRD